VAVVLRPGKTPGGVEVRAHLRRLIRHIRTRWHKTRITFRGDGHYARPEAMTWCENNGIDYIFGLSGTKPLARKVDEVADDIRTRRAIDNLPVLRGYTETRHKAKSWDRERRTVARITGGEKPKAILCASSEEACGRVNRTKKTVPSRIGRAKFEAAPPGPTVVCDELNVSLFRAAIAAH
jgi:hypothetical protein